MAKRFTDTAKWDKAWFRKLSPLSKCVWFFLCDRCDHAGIWDIDEEAFEHFIGEELSIADILDAFPGKIQLVADNKLFVSAFIDFQYGQLNPENRVHKSVLDRLNKLHLKPLIRGSEGCKDKDKDKDTRGAGGIRDWNDAAGAVLACVVKYGDWSKSEAEVRASLGDALFENCLRAGVHNLRRVPLDHYAVSNVIKILKNANQQLDLFKSNRAQLFQKLEGQLAEVSR